MLLVTVKRRLKATCDGQVGVEGSLLIGDQAPYAAKRTEEDSYTDIYRGSPPHYRPTELVTPSLTRSIVLIYPDLSVCLQYCATSLLVVALAVAVAVAVANDRQGKGRRQGIGPVDCVQR